MEREKIIHHFISAFSDLTRSDLIEIKAERRFLISKIIPEFEKMRVGYRFNYQAKRCMMSLRSNRNDLHTFHNSFVTEINLRLKAEPSSRLEKGIYSSLVKASILIQDDFELLTKQIGGSVFISDTDANSFNITMLSIDSGVMPTLLNPAAPHQNLRR